MKNDEQDLIEGELIAVAEIETVSLITKAEIDTQISTAKKYPRSIKKFMNSVREMVTLSEDIAGECIYALPRGGKTIEGPSSRFAEIVASAWGNCRAGARVVAEDDKFVTAQGVFHDLEQNVAITFEIKRRITDKHGRKFQDDMIGVTGNAASSIALRNAVLKGVPKAFWTQLYLDARKCAVGDVQTLPNRRAKMLDAFSKIGVTEKMIIELLEVKGTEDIGLDHLSTLVGLFQAIKGGDTTVEQAFNKPQPGGKVGASTLNEKLNSDPTKTNETLPTKDEASKKGGKLL